MASIRRTLSLVPRPGNSTNGEACAAASPMSQASCNSNYPHPYGSFTPSFCSLDRALYRAQTFILDFFSQRPSRTLERSKSMRQSWRRALFHFFVFFILGVFVGLTPFASPALSMNLMSKHQAFTFEMLRRVDRIQFYDAPRNETSVVEKMSMNDNATSEEHTSQDEAKDEILVNSFSNQSFDQDSNVSFHKLLIIVTPTYARPLQAYYLNRLVHTLKLVPPPLLWIVVEVSSQSVTIAEILRNSGVMYRHLVCSENLTDINDRGMHLRNVALSHIELHHLDGIVYFADEQNAYALDLFEQMRQIRQFGTWVVGKLVESKRDVILDGPICNGSQVIGWHTHDVRKKFQRFPAEIAGFAFNSTLLWDPKKWHRPTLEPIRLLDAFKEGFRVSSFIEQVVEDESQMEGFPLDCSYVMVWHLNAVSFYSYHGESSTINTLLHTAPFA